MIIEPFETIIFDCDGTLVDSEPITVKVLIDQVAQLGLEMQYDEAISIFAGRDMSVVAEVIASRLGGPLPDDFVDQFRQRQARALRSDLLPIAGAEQLLAQITKPYCVASNAPHAKIKINLESTGLDRFFQPQTTFSAYDIQKWKPEPDLFLHVADRMSTSPQRCVVIEDSLAGIQAGIAAKMQVIGYSPTPEGIVTGEVPYVHCLLDLIDHLR